MKALVRSWIDRVMPKTDGNDPMYFHETVVVVHSRAGSHTVRSRWLQAFLLRMFQ